MGNELFTVYFILHVVVAYLYERYVSADRAFGGSMILTVLPFFIGMYHQFVFNFGHGPRASISFVQEMIREARFSEA